MSPGKIIIIARIGILSIFTFVIVLWLILTDLCCLSGRLLCVVVSAGVDDLHPRLGWSSSVNGVESADSQLSETYGGNTTSIGLI